MDLYIDIWEFARRGKHITAADGGTLSLLYDIMYKTSSVLSSFGQMFGY